MNRKSVGECVQNVRKALENARDAGCFIGNVWMENFPHASCLRATELLAEYLRRNGIKTIIVQGSEEEWTHAWLVLNDRDIQPEEQVTHFPPKIVETLRSYGADPDFSGTVINTQYEEEAIRRMTVVDITIDQFGPQYSAPYIGPELVLHQKFSITEAKEYKGGCEMRLYNAIEQWLE